MSRVIDALIAYRLVKLLVTPFNKTDAYKLGIIDEKGKVLIKSRKITNQKQRKAYTLLIRFVFNLKKLLAKVGIRGPIGSAAAAAIASSDMAGGSCDPRQTRFLPRTNCKVLYIIIIATRPKHDRTQI